MADDLGLYWSLFQGEFPDEWKSDPDFALYLSQLSSLSMEKLQLEPEHLREERRCVLNSTQKLAFNNYMTFIQTAECTREVFKDFVAVEDHVTQLLDKIPEFSSACKKFAKDSQDINAKRKLNSLALSKHTQLLEILEIPQVMETCVRNGYYEEALDLNAHVRRMDKKHGEIPIIKAIAKDVSGSMELMLSQLLGQLRGSIQLPTCLKVVGFLRRMEVFSDVELRLKFLQARDAWLQSVLAAVPTDDPYHHISKTIEASRVHLFDVVTQYRAIFPDDDSVRVNYGGPKTKGEGPVDGALFYSWVNDKIWQFLHILEEDLQRGVGGRMDSVLSQCMYFGLSFSRIGADFRGLIAPVFVRVLAETFRRSLRDAKHVFHESMKRMTLSSPLRELTTPTMTSSMTAASLSSPSLSPPHTLLDFPPLAQLTNALIHAFNELRQCAPLSLAPSIAQEIRRLLESTVHDIGEYYRVEHGSFTQQEVTAFNQLVRVMARDFLPFVKRIFTSLFSETAVEQLSLSTPYALRHGKKTTPTSGTTTSSDGGVRLVKVRTGRPGVELGMDLNMEAIAEPLRKIAPGVFEEMDRLKQQQFTAAVASMGGDTASGLHNATSTSAIDDLGSLGTSDATREGKEGEDTEGQERERESKDDGVSEQSTSHRLLLIKDQSTAAETEMIHPSVATAELDGKPPPSDTGSHRSTKSQESTEFNHSVTINSTRNVTINSDGGSQSLAGASPSLVGQLPTGTASLAIGQSAMAAANNSTRTIHHTATPLAKDKAA